MKIRFDHAVIHVSNWAKSNEFYARVLGAEIIPRGEGFAFQFGEFQLNCHGPGLSPNPLAKIPVEPGNSDLCFAFDGPIEAAISHLESCGVAIELGPVE